MHFDKQLMFFDGQVITSAGNYESASYDLGPDPRVWIGAGNELEIWASMVETAAGGTSMQMQLVTDDNALLSTPTVHVQTPAIPTADLVAGYRFKITSIPKVNLGERYLGLRIVSVGTFTAGQVTAGIVTPGDSWRQYPAEQGSLLG